MNDMEYKPMEWVICDICDGKYPASFAECPRRLDPAGHRKLVRIDGVLCFADLADDIEQDLEGWPP